MLAALKTLLHNFLSSFMRQLHISKIYRRVLVIAIQKQRRLWKTKKLVDKYINFTVCLYKKFKMLTYVCIKPIDLLFSREERQKVSYRSSCFINAKHRGISRG